MSFRAISLLAGMGLLGLLASLVLDSGNGSGDSNQSQADIWEQPSQPINYSNSSDRFLSALSTGKLFPNTRPGGAAIAEEQQAVTDEDQPTVFPTLVSISRLDGTFNALVAYEDGQRATVEQGDLLVDDWTVAELSSDTLVAQLGSDRVRIPLFLSID